MGTDDGNALDDSPYGSGDSGTSAPPEKLSGAFYAALLLIAILSGMILFLNYPAVKAEAGPSLAGTRWVLGFIGDADGKPVPVPTGGISLTFGRENRLNGTVGCSRYTAVYATREYEITISGITITPGVCPDSGDMQDEPAYLATLSRVAFFRSSASSLKFYDGNGAMVFTFVPG